MKLSKILVFAALVVALAVNIEAHRRGWMGIPIETAQADELQQPEMMEPHPCALDPMWQCHNTQKWLACQFSRECIINEGIAI